MLKLPVNIDELAFVLHRSDELEMECFLNKTSGRIINIPTNRNILKDILGLDEEAELLQMQALIEMILPDKDNYIHIPNQFPQIAYTLMTGFTELIKQQKPGMHDELWRFISKEGGYAEFQKAIRNYPELRKKFIVYRDKSFEAAAMIWLEQNNIQLIPHFSSLN